MYQTDITDFQWEVIKKNLSRKIWGRKRKYSIRLLINAILYVTKSGIQWRMLPNDFPDWELVYYYHQTWSSKGIVKQIHDSLVIQVRLENGKESSPSLGLVDSQSIKTMSFTDEKGYDGNKKVVGRKRFIVTDTLGRFAAAINYGISYLYS
jgi:putative transposase